MDTQIVRRGRPLSTVKVANRLREYRLRANLSQSELAKLIGDCQENISIAETRGRGLSTEKWFRCAALFNVDPRELQGWQPPPDLKKIIGQDA